MKDKIKGMHLEGLYKETYADPVRLDRNNGTDHAPPGKAYDLGAARVTQEERDLLSMMRIPWSHWRAGMPEQDMVEIERLADKYDTDPRVLWCSWSVGYKRGKEGKKR